MRFKESLQFAIKCMKYSFNLKTNLICAAIIFILGTLYEIMELGNGFGSYLMLLVAMYPAQMIYSISGSHLVQSSPYKKSLMTSIPTMITFCSGILIFLLVIVIKGVRIAMKPEAAEQNIYSIMIAGLTLLLLDIYVGFVYKYFVASMVILCISVVSIYSNIDFLGQFHQITWIFSRCTLPAAIVVGLCLALLGSLLQYGFSLLTYKKPISKYAVYGMLRQQV